MDGLPAGFQDARQFAFVGQLAQTQSAGAKLPVITPWPSTKTAAVMKLYLGEFAA